MENYDERCQAAASEAEMRLLDHFKQFGGEVWTIGSGCQQCRQKLEDTSALKKCSNCEAALFCGRDCQVGSWSKHKAECNVITTFRKISAVQEEDAKALIKVSLETLTLTASVKQSAEPTVAGVAVSLQMSAAQLPGWFFSVDFEQESKLRQKELYQTALELFALLRDEESWIRDKESFPRSSYTHVESLPHGPVNAATLREHFIAMNGHLVVFSAWLQHPEPPATQSVPLEDRSFFGVLDSLLQISLIRDGIDAFMDARA